VSLLNGMKGVTTPALEGLKDAEDLWGATPE
jgi:hypothetical protein